MASIASQTSIANLALTGLGADSIISLSEDSQNARRINAVWDLVRDEVLRAHTWHFAKELIEFNLLAAAPVYKYSSAFQVPGRVIRILDTEFDFAWERQGDTVLSNEDSFKCECIVRVTDTTKWDTAFVTMFSARIEAQIAYAVTNSRTIQADRVNSYLKMLRETKAFNAQEGSLTELEANTWLLSRFDGRDTPLAEP